MDKRIIAPPKLYLDTNHLINIAKLRRGEVLPSGKFTQAYREIDKHIRTGLCGIIFSPDTPLDWAHGRATPKSARQIAAVVDSAKLQYEIEPARFVWVQEVLRECHRVDCAIRVLNWPIIHVRAIGRVVERALGIVATRAPGYFEEGELGKEGTSLTKGRAFEPACVHVDAMFDLKQRNPEMLEQRKALYKVAFLKDVANASARGSSGVRKEDVREWMKQSLRVDRILAALNPKLDASDLLECVDWLRCPAIVLFLRARWKEIEQGHQPRDGDVDDWSSVPVVPYADIVLTERHLRAMIHEADPSTQAKVTSDPNEAAGMMCKWGG